MRLSNIVPQIGDGSKGWPMQAPFDRIIVTARAEILPDILVQQLREDGIMILPIVKKDRSQKVVRLRRRSNGFDQEELMDARFVPLLDGLPSLTPEN